MRTFNIIVERDPELEMPPAFARMRPFSSRALAAGSVRRR